MTVKRITRAGRADVYNMEVDDTHDFVIQGGVISHNCADESRYFCMARPIGPRINLPPDGYHTSPQALFLDIPKEDVLPRREDIPQTKIIYD